MGLLKEIENENGIKLKYHRIIDIYNITNVSTTIDIASYTSQNKRELEKQYIILQSQKMSNNQLTDEEQELLDNGISVYTYSKSYLLPYDKNINVDTAYNYLKTLDDFKDAKDI